MVPAASKFRNPAFLAAQYFGMGDVQSINPAAMDKGPGSKRGGGKPCFATFLEGLERGYHAVSRRAWAMLANRSA